MISLFDTILAKRIFFSFLWDLTLKCVKCCAFWRKFSQAGLGRRRQLVLCGDNQESISGAESADGCLHFHIHPNTTIKKQKSIQIQLSRNENISKCVFTSFTSIQIQPSRNKKPSTYYYQETKTVQNNKTKHPKVHFRQMDFNIFSSTHSRLNPKTLSKMLTHVFSCITLISSYI